MLSMFYSMAYLLLGALLAVILLVVILIIIIKGKKKWHVKVDEEFIQNLIVNLGGKENINNVEVEQARLKISLKDVTKANLNAIKEVAEKGVFVTGNNVKTLFKYESKLIASQLKKKI